MKNLWPIEYVGNCIGSRLIGSSSLVIEFNRAPPIYSARASTLEGEWVNLHLPTVSYETAWQATSDVICTFGHKLMDCDTQRCNTILLTALTSSAGCACSHPGDNSIGTSPLTVWWLNSIGLLRIYSACASALAGEWVNLNQLLVSYETLWQATSDCHCSFGHQLIYCETQMCNIILLTTLTCNAACSHSEW